MLPRRRCPHFIPLPLTLASHKRVWTLHCGNMQSPPSRAPLITDVPVSMFNCSSRVRLFATPRTVGFQAPLSMGFSRKNTGVGCHALLRGIFTNQERTCICCVSCITGEFFNAEPLGKPLTIDMISPSPLL